MITAGDKSIFGVVDAILEVGRERKAILDRLRAALESGDSQSSIGVGSAIVWAR